MQPRSRLSIFVLAGAVACAPASRQVSTPAYTPRARDITITTVPLLVKEARNLYPFLASAFAAGGALDGKEVYGFSPSSITVVQGDTVHFTFVNPEDDVHSFVLPDFVQALPGNSATTATWIAKRAGIFAFKCSVPTHLPMMWGQLVVLSPLAVASGS